MPSLWPFNSKSTDQQTPEPTPKVTSAPSSPPSQQSSSWISNSEAQAPLLEPGALSQVDILVAKFNAALSSTSPIVIAAVSVTVGGAAAVTGGFIYGRYGRRLRNSDWITPDWLGGKRWVRGVVTSVGDGDNFRLFHTPAFGFYHLPFKMRQIPKDLKDETLHIRLAGVDAPEGAHFGKPGQPFAAESLAWLRGKLKGRKVYCQLIRKDQYSRIVAHVYRPYPLIPGFLVKGKNVSRWMLKTGYACVYEQAGAEYGKYGKDDFLTLEARAKKLRLGQWGSPSALRGESPAEYKKRLTL